MIIGGYQTGHDCSYCILVDGIPTIHEELERFNRVKESLGDGLRLLSKSYSLDSLDGIATVYHGPNGPYTDQCTTPELQAAKGLKEKLASTIKIDYEQGHHQAHAANAFFSSNYEKALIFTLDAGGWDFQHYNFKGQPSGPVRATACTVWKGRGSAITSLKIYPFEEMNIGSLWHNLLRPVFDLSTGTPLGNQSGTVMAMAALGDYSKYLNLFLAYAHNSQVLQNYLPNEEEEKYNIAAALQKYTEVKIEDLIGNYLGDETNICIAGGVALNSVIIGKIQEWYPQIKGVYIPPVPYDGGLSIGAAQLVYHQTLCKPRVTWDKNASPYLGRVYARADIDAAAPDAVETNIDHVLELIAQGNIIALFKGPSESGRRALGNRSIIADPRRKDMKDKINHKVKHRQHFRPFAPSILRERVSDWFVRDIESPYMTAVLPFLEEQVDKVPAVVHLDGTGRLQTVREEDNPSYYNLLKRWEDKTGIPILLNTSFNDREPIVETPQHAVDCLRKTDIDYLYFLEENLLLANKDETQT